MAAIPRVERGTNEFMQIRFLGDPSAAFTKALELEFDGTAVFGGPRGKRYALVVENGHVAAAYVEPDNIGTSGKPPFYGPVTESVLTAVQSRWRRTFWAKRERG